MSLPKQRRPHRMPTLRQPIRGVKTVRRASHLAVLVVAIAGALGVFAASAYAEPSYTTVCGSCHSGSGVSVAATKSSSDATTTTYSVVVTGGTGQVGWAVFNGSTKVTDGTSATGSFTVDDGTTYTVYAVNYSSATTDGLGQTSVSPASSATPPSLTGTDTTAPVTTSDVHAATYPVQAVITLTSTDSLASGDTGCWGVAYMYYRVDSGAANDNDPADSGPTHVVALTTSAYTHSCTVTIPGPAAGSGQAVTHTIEYWSQDAAGNVESPTTKTFTITPAPTLSSFSPGNGVVGSKVTLTGSGFTAATDVSLSGKAASFKVVSDTEITATVPTGASSGTFVVTAPGGKVTSGSSFTVVTTAHLTITTSGVSHGVLKLGKRMTAKGILTPASLAGEAVTVTVQRKHGGKWVTVKSATSQDGRDWRLQLAVQAR